MPEILDQQEVEALLAAIDEGEVKEEGPLGEKEFASYDFSRPERISKDDARSIEALHIDVARSYSAILSGYLRTIVEVKLSSVEEINYAEFILSVPNPTYLNVLSAKPLEGEMVLEMNPSIVFPILDKLLGGSSEEVTIPNRPLTEIELRIMDKIIQRAIEALNTEWSKISPVTFEVIDTEYNPQLLQIIPPTETVVLVGFEISLGNFSGMLNFCIPFVSLDPILGHLSAHRWRAYSHGKAQEEILPGIEETIRATYLEVTACLAETTIALKDLLELRVGDLIQTGKSTSESAVVSVRGRPKFLAKPGQFRRKKAALIVGTLPGARVSSA